MNLNSFAYVAEIERCGSINRAAQNLYTSQSNLSIALKQLEDELGYSIFKRTSHGSVPTPEGYLFIQSAKAILAEIERINEIPNRTGSADTISLSCNWSGQILQTLVDFKQHHHSVNEDTYRETSLRQNFECIYENLYRLAIIDCFHSLSDYYRQEAKNTNLDAIVLKRNLPAMALMSKNHPLAKQKMVSKSEVYGYPLVLFEDYRDPDRIKTMGMENLNQILYLYDRGGILDVLQASNSVSILKVGTFVDLDKHDLIELPIHDFGESYDVILLKREYYQLNNREKEFIDLLCGRL
ncbi:MAG: LysR family transcriptional regulator [Eubacterium sp.]|nr:LysR family transcriptional regulator [Candidatus Colimonas fimequi]